MVIPRWPNDSMTRLVQSWCDILLQAWGDSKLLQRVTRSQRVPSPMATPASRILFLFGLLLLVLILFCGKIETKIIFFTFKVLSSGALNIWAMLCGPHHYLLQEFSSLLMETPCLLSNSMAPHSPSPWDPCLSVFYPMNLPILDIVCK